MVDNAVMIQALFVLQFIAPVFNSYAMLPQMLIAEKHNYGAVSLETLYVIKNTLC